MLWHACAPAFLYWNRCALRFVADPPVAKMGRLGIVSRNPVRHPQYYCGSSQWKSCLTKITLIWSFQNKCWIFELIWDGFESASIDMLRPLSNDYDILMTFMILFFCLPTALRKTTIGYTPPSTKFIGYHLPRGLWYVLRLRNVANIKCKDAIYFFSRVQTP